MTTYTVAGWLEQSNGERSPHGNPLTGKPAVLPLDGKGWLPHLLRGSNNVLGGVHKVTVEWKDGTKVVHIIQGVEDELRPDPQAIEPQGPEG